MIEPHSFVSPVLMHSGVGFVILVCSEINSRVEDDPDYPAASATGAGITDVSYHTVRLVLVNSLLPETMFMRSNFFKKDFYIFGNGFFSFFFLN